MKKILITTTALVATAGVAAAEVSLSGLARFGYVSTETAAGATTTGTASRMRIQAAVSTTTDGGIGLNARQRFQTEENSANAGGNGARFGLSFGGLSINMGNINGAVDSAPGLYMGTNSGGVGLEGNQWANIALNNAGNVWNWEAHSSAGAGAQNGVEAIFSLNGIGVHISNTDTATGYGVNYSMGNITLAAAREDKTSGADDGDQITFASAGVSLSDLNVTASWGSQSGTTKSVIAATYDMSDAMNLHGHFGSEDAGSSYGIGVNYSLGGGAFIDAGYDKSAAGTTRMSAGVQFFF